LRDDDPCGRRFPMPIRKTVAGEDQGAENEEVNQRFPEQAFHAPGVYQIGDV
jgi:hypothetical protein